jgi:surface antigen
VVSNGTDQLPQVGAVISFSANSSFSDVGHAAVVTAVSADSVTVVSENQNSLKGYSGFTAGAATMRVTGDDYIHSYCCVS